MIEWKTKTYCDNCPFLNNKMRVDKDRMDDVKADLRKGNSFTCHKTAYPDVFDMPEDTKPLMCHGAYVYLEKIGKPNQIMQIAKRMGV